jgi:alkane 1-monooxygenase
MWKYARYGLLTTIGLGSLAAMFAGGAAMWVPFWSAVFLALGGDAIFGDDLSEPEYGHTWLLDAQLYSNLPLLLGLTFAFLWQISPTDLLGVGAAIESLTGFDAVAAREANAWWHYLGGGLGLGLFYGVAGTNVGHELTHRTWSAPAQIVGRWLLAFTSDASFAIEHVYGHHKHVATRQDPATSRRGENVYGFVLRSTVQSYISAWGIERERLAKQGRSVWSWRNRMHRGNLMTATYAALFYWGAGWMGVGVFMVVSLYGKAWLEMVNFTEHYGIVRVPGAPVEPRHSWNCNRRISGYLLYNLTRHSHHHAMGEKPFWELRAYPETPTMPYGYLTMIAVALVPPLWDRIMIPRVLAWDRHFAADSERELIAEANRLSGKAAFTDEPPAELPRIHGDALPARPALERAADDASNDDREGGLGKVIRGLFGREGTSTARLEPLGMDVEVPHGETLLGAALNAGVAFPHNCRVGGCASCKCKITSGAVKELTDASYILSADEVREGYVLACQSVPRTPHLSIEVPGLERAGAHTERVRTSGVITALRPLNHDILELELQLDDPVAYTAGQYAELRVPGVVERARSYSFAAAPEAARAGLVRFHVRKVDGGAFTTWLHERAEVGDDVELEGPFGDFWLRPSGAPILAIAGGSGLAPIEAILEQARADLLARDVVLLYGARTQADLYHVADLEEMARGWLARMTFVPVLSEEPAGSDWEGLRGLVTEHIGAVAGSRLPEHHVYMCGPPAMIDAAEQALTRYGVPSANVHSDKFLDASHLAAMGLADAS